jgi:hypothetical protein
VDATYQASLRDFNESNFSRFDARMEQRIAGLQSRIDGVESRIDGVESRLEMRLDSKIDSLEQRMERRFAELSEALVTRIVSGESRMLRWMIGLWTGTILTMAGLFVALLQLR